MELSVTTIIFASVFVFETSARGGNAGRGLRETNALEVMFRG